MWLLRRTVKGDKDIDGAPVDPRLDAVFGGVTDGRDECRIIDDAIEGRHRSRCLCGVLIVEIADIGVENHQGVPMQLLNASQLNQSVGEQW